MSDYNRRPMQTTPNSYRGGRNTRSSYQTSQSTTYNNGAGYASQSDTSAAQQQYQSHQNQAKPAQVQQQYQPQQMQQQNYQQQLQQQQQMQQQQLNTPVIKTEPKTPQPAAVQSAPPPPPPAAPTNTSATTKALDAMEQDGVQDGTQPRKWTWFKKRKTSNVLRKVNRHKTVSRIAMPKPPQQVLHELRPTVTYNHNIGSSADYLCTAMDGEQVLGTGVGSSKSAAKSAASEAAIKMLVREQIRKARMEQPSAPGADGMEVEPSMAENSNIPWADLASFAMFRLLNEWRSEGLDLPLPGGDAFKPKPMETPIVRATPTAGAPRVKTELPPNPEKMHPCQLLNLMRPGLQINELTRQGQGNAPLVTVGCEIDNKMYTGTGSNRKKAKMECARAICSVLFNVTFE